MFTDLSPAWISFRAAILATIITFFLGIIAARFMLNYRGKTQGLIDAIFTAPLVLPPTVVGFLLLILFGRYGPLGKLLALFDLSVIFTWYATVIAATIVAFPLMYKTALGAFRQIDQTILASARTLGASEWMIFWRILLPLAKPGLIAGTLLAFARSLGEFGATLMLAGSIPGQTQTIPIAIFFAAEAGNMDEAFAWVLVILVISLGIITAVNIWSREPGLDVNSNRNLKYKKNKLNHQINIRSQQQIPGLSSPNSELLGKDFLGLPNSQTQIQLTVDIQKQLPGFLLNVSFQIHDQPLGFLGASGAGKSFILRCIAGLETPDQGKIILNGKTLFDSDRGINLPSRDRKIGYLFQNYALFPHLTVAQNIAFGFPKGLSNLQIKQRVEQQLVTVDLTGLGHRYPRELSGGQQQRVALARSLASAPEVLLLDEPFSALDTYLRDRMEKLLRSTLESYRGVTLFITHNLEEAYRICQNLLVIDQGEIIAQGSKYEIFEHPHYFRVAQLTGCKNFSTAVPLGPNQVRALDWDCTLHTLEPVPENLVQVGIRAHQITFLSPDFPESIPEMANTFPCWLAATSETQHRITLYLKLHHASTHPLDYHVQAEVFKENWSIMKDDDFPWRIQLKPMQLILLKAWD
ncbi:MAG: molybdate ABC transporter permease subunit [Oscillatoriales cyanobacterium RM2_1_1]|nr:molybdate ABC transporter permease subunit [Oscillatoriales cyanobacterium SM2_3_0]NJO45457.1 molybdate ABC transporter permease subunit [Oscillatoriales cyanobacterium RM2_1_1]